MGLTTERKVFFGILVAAGIALVIDQGILGPSNASAMSDSELTTTDQTGEPAPIIQTGGSTSGMTAAKLLMERLSQQDPSPAHSSLGSGFSLEQLIEPALGAVSENKANPQSQPTEPTLPMIQPSAPDLPRLTAVMPSASGGGAVLGGKLIRVGQKDPNGFTLMQVRERGVVLQRDGRLYSIEIPTQGGP